MQQRQYRHIRDKEIYTYLFEAFNVETQLSQVVYINRLGQIFTREVSKFHEKFEIMGGSEQESIRPHDPHK